MALLQHLNGGRSTRVSEQYGHSCHVQPVRSYISVCTTELGWGGGIEATGLTPDVIVDNDPRMTFNGKDAQLERAIVELKRLLKEDPIPPFEVPPTRPDMSLHGEQCSGDKL